MESQLYKGSQMKLTILGCHSATPRINEHPTSQVLEVRGHLFLIDCGEGTQVQLRKHKVKFSRNKIDKTIKHKIFK